MSTSRMNRQSLLHNVATAPLQRRSRSQKKKKKLGYPAITHKE